MDTFVNVLALFLVVIAVVPLLLLGFYVLASHFNFQWADGFLSYTVWFLKLQWVSGMLINLVGGLALALLGAWAIGHFDQIWQRVAGMLLAAWGLWRGYLGAALLIQARRDAARTK